MRLFKPQKKTSYKMPAEDADTLTTVARVLGWQVDVNETTGGVSLEKEVDCSELPIALFFQGKKLGELPRLIRQEAASPVNLKDLGVESCTVAELQELVDHRLKRAAELEFLACGIENMM